MKIQLFTRVSFYCNANGDRRQQRINYFRVRADNGEIILQSEGYNSKAARNATVKLLTRTDWSQVQVQDVGEAEL